MPALKHRPGSRFGRLVIESRDRLKITCRCDCGKQTVVHLANLCTGHTISCGCVRAEATAARSFKHGGSRRGARTPEYQVWTGLHKCCSNPKSKDWPNYGGRGIVVCDRWSGETGFANFLEDMGPRPAGHSIERQENDGPYSKGNCIWAPRLEQNRNTRRSRFLTHAGRTQTLSQWAAELRISHSSIINRLRRGWPVSRALSEPAHVA